MKKQLVALAIGTSMFALVAAGSASASLNVFQTYVGSYGVSSTGFGSTSDAGNITATVPAGSTVVAAYLYSNTYFNAPPPTGTLAGDTVNYSTALANIGSLQASRADVTSILAPLINGGPGGTYSFGITETSSNVNGEALVVIYQNAALSTTTIGILDGGSAQGGDNSTISFGTPLDPSAPGFQAEMRIGDSHSCCDQASTITVNGNTLTTVAGNDDDNVDGFDANGNLITVGGQDDPFTAASLGSPATNYATDHERYDLSSFIAQGDTAIHINTVNPSQDDDIFLEIFQVTGEGHVSSGTPEPATWAMMLTGFAGLGAMLRRRKAASAAA